MIYSIFDTHALKLKILHHKCFFYSFKSILCKYRKSYEKKTEFWFNLNKRWKGNSITSCILNMLPLYTYDMRFYALSSFHFSFFLAR